MKKMMLIALAALMASPLFICSCGEKTTEEQAKDKIEEAQKAANDAADKAKDAANDAADKAKGAVDNLLKK